MGWNIYDAPAGVGMVDVYTARLYASVHGPSVDSGVSARDGISGEEPYYEIWKLPKY